MSLRPRWPRLATNLDSVPDYAHHVLLCLKAVPVRALLLQCADDALDYAVLLRAVRRDELPLETASERQAHVVPAREHQAVSPITDELEVEVVARLH